MGNLILVDAGNRSAEAAACLADSFVAKVPLGAPVSGAGMMVEGDHRIAVDDIEREMACWPPPGGRRPNVVQPVPGHDGVLPVGLGRCGGALGLLQRVKVSMMIMCPPQHGHGGRTSSGSSGRSSSGGGATASNSRARTRLALRAEAESRP